MKRNILALTVFLVLAFPATQVYAAEDTVVQKTFFERILSSITALFTRETFSQATSSGTVELGESRSELLKFLNKRELVIRVGVSGRDLYLAKEDVLPKLEESMDTIRSLNIQKEHKEEILSELGDIKKVYLLDLVDSPHDKIKPEILDAFDTSQTLVFKMTEEEASLILQELKKFGFS